MADDRARAEALVVALEAAGIELQVEARGRMAILTPVAGGWQPMTPALRSQVYDMARSQGFTHAALELPGAESCDSSSP